MQVWDVVDKAQKKTAQGSELKLSFEQERAAAAVAANPAAATEKRGSQRTGSSSARGLTQVESLDASVLDIYKGTHAAIFMCDPTKRWTFEYLEREVWLLWGFGGNES